MPAVINQPYNQQLTVVGGTAPYVFSLKSGSPPAGITMDANGLLSGTPTILGTANFTVQAVDGFNGYGERAYALEVIPGNTWTTTLESLDPDHKWDLDEASGLTLADSGDTGGFDFTIANENEYWHQAPALFARAGSPVYGLIKPQNSQPRPTFAGGITPAGETSGGIGCWFRVFNQTLSSPAALLVAYYNNNGDVSLRLEVTTDFRSVLTEVVAAQLGSDGTKGLFPGFEAKPLGIVG